MMLRRVTWICLLIVAWGAVPIAQGQVRCAAVDRVFAPVDMAAFALVQDYGVRSPRHDGRYHTGEDWALLDGNTRGQPVRAIANGVVTYAYDQGWGKDGGVIILEHTLADESTVYSVYGHLAATESTPFPNGNACVSAGDVIGLIGDARPSAHLHFEIRVSNGRSPGQGYTWVYPNEEGYRRPSQFLQNTSAELDRTVNWVTRLNRETSYTTPPLALNDNSLLVPNGAQIARILPDGRQLWRKTYERDIVAVRGFEGNPFAYFNDGLVHQIFAVDGTLGDFWRVNAPLAGAPFEMDDLLVFPASTGGLLAVDVRRREIAWEAANVPMFTQVTRGAQVMTLQTHTSELVTLSVNSRAPLDTAHVRNGASITVSSDGTLIVYTQGGLWRILADGVWQAVDYDVPAPKPHGAIATSSNGDLLLFDGEAVRSYAQNGVQQWAFDVPGTRGRAALTEIDGRTLLYTTNGDIAVVSPLGKVCQLKVWGHPGAYLWHHMGDDDTLRVMIGGTLTGINWQRFSRECE